MYIKEISPPSPAERQESQRLPEEQDLALVLAAGSKPSPKDAFRARSGAGKMLLG